MIRSKKFIYLFFIGGLTSTALSAAYWQTNRYYQSKQKWKIIAKQLNNQNPPNFAELSNQQIYTLKYIKINGTLQNKCIYIKRTREGRVGSLVVRPIQYQDINTKQKKYILAVQGWIPDDYEYNPNAEYKTVKGILRQKQKSDYLHKKMKQSDIEKFNINTYIDMEKSAEKLGINIDKMHMQHYVQILKDLNENQKQGENTYYPYQYRVDNFQLPYLTPQKHQGYATFWSLTSLVGITAIIKVLKMK